jgi:phosphonate transport system substrate-binding protein
MAALAALGLSVAACGPSTPANYDPTKPWTKTVKELRIGVAGAETDEVQLAKLREYEAYLAEELGLPVRSYTASDYNGVAQAMAAGQIEMAQGGAANYVNMYLEMGDKVRPILTTKEVDGSLGYYSVIVVRADSPYKSIDELKGKTLAFADVNSTSGYLLPSQILRSEGKEPSKFFGKTIFAGGHEQAVIAVVQKQADAAATWSSGIGNESEGFTRGNLRKMVDSKMLNMKDIRVIWKGGPIPNGPLVVRGDLPPELIEAIMVAHEKLKDAKPDVYAVVSRGQGAGYVRVDHKFYEKVVEMRKAEEAARRDR